MNAYCWIGPSVSLKEMQPHKAKGSDPADTDLATVMQSPMLQLQAGQSLYMSGGRGAIQRLLTPLRGGAWTIFAPRGQLLVVTYKKAHVGVHSQRVLQVHGCNDGPGDFRGDENKIRLEQNAMFHVTDLNLAWLLNVLLRIWGDHRGTGD